MDYKSRLHGVVDQWVKLHHTTYEAMLKSAGLSGPVGTDIRKGSRPRPESIRKLSRVLGIDYGQFLEVAGYSAEEIALWQGEADTGVNAEEEVFLGWFRLLSPAGRNAIGVVMEQLLWPGAQANEISSVVEGQRRYQATPEPQ